MRIIYVLRYFFREAVLNLWTNRLNNFISIAIISFSLFTIGLFLLTAENLGNLIGHWTESVQINVFLQKGTTREQASTLESLIKVAPVVSGFQFITDEDALRRFREYYPAMRELSNELDSNPFPPSFEITIRREFQDKPAVQEFVQQLRTERFVEDVEYDQDWIDRVQFMIQFVRMIGLCFGGILMFAATFSISNVIKLMVLSRRDEIEIMRLVGATNSFIKGPFLSEGILQGFLSGCIAVLLLFTIYQVILGRLGSIQAPFFSVSQLQFLSPTLIAAVITGGMVVGFLGSLFSLSRLLRI